jgi:hypothetical protein
MLHTQVPGGRAYGDAPEITRRLQARRPMLLEVYRHPSDRKGLSNIKFPAHQKLEIRDWDATINP